MKKNLFSFFLFLFSFSLLFSISEYKFDSTKNIFEDSELKKRLRYKNSFKGKFEQYGDPLLFSVPIVCWLTSRYCVSRNIRPEFMKKMQLSGKLAMELHLLYRVIKGCHYFFDSASRGEKIVDSLTYATQHNMLTEALRQIRDGCLYLFRKRIIFDLIHIIVNARPDSSVQINIHTGKKRKNTEEENVEREKKEEQKPSFALLGLLAVPIIVTGSLIWAMIYNQPFFKECKELQSILEKHNTDEEKEKINEYVNNIQNYNHYVSGNNDANNVSKEAYEKAIEVLIYNKTLIEEFLSELVKNSVEENPYKVAFEVN
jgi:hypothetical protein